MASIRWCLNVKNGIELAEPNNNMPNSYLKMAEESLEVIKKIESELWIASTSYYTIYYSLYAVMIKIGVKCEIHQCSIEFMKRYLPNFYSLFEVDLIKTAFEVRNDMQYYPEKLVDRKKLERVRRGAADFLVKSRDIISRITEKEINQIREELAKEIKKK